MTSLLFLMLFYAHSITVDSIILKNADSMIRDISTQTVVLQGNVQVIHQQQYISCDEAIIHLETKTLEALGNVIYTTPTMYAEADKMFFNYENNTGVIYNGYIQSGQVSFEGELIYKVGDNDFEATKSLFTSCISCPPAWSFSGSEIRASFGGYARIKNPILRLADLPVLWFPYIILPLKNERQSGFLTPSYEISRRAGNIISIPYFWAISDNKDMTLTLEHSEFLGLKPLIQYRYVLAPGSKGQLDYGQIKDRKFSSSDRILDVYGTNIPTKNRWFLSYNHQYQLPSYFEHRMDINLASDLMYSYDYPEEFPFYREPSIHNRMSLSRYHPNVHTSIDGHYHINQLKTDPLADNSDAVHKMPEFRLQTKTQRIKNTNLYWNLDANYTNFARNNFSFDDLNNNGIFDEGDVIRAGQRLILKPEIMSPMQIGNYLDVLPSISYQENFYRLAEVAGDNPHSRFLQTKVSVRAKASRVFDNDDPKEDTYKHDISPFITYSKLPFVDRNDHSFWGESDLVPYSSDLSISNSDSLQFDFKDRPQQKDVVEFGLMNTVTRRRYLNGNYNYRDTFLWRIAQRYDFQEARKTGPGTESWSSINNRIQYWHDKYTLSSTVDYYPYQNIINSSTKLRYNLQQIGYLQIGYNQAFIVTKGQPTSASSESKDILLSSGMRLGNYNVAGNMEYSAVTRSFENYQYGIQYMPPGDCWYFSITQSVNSQDIKTKFKFEFLFDGTTRRFNPSNIF